MRNPVVTTGGGDLPFSIELERALRGEVDSSESGKVIERLESAAGLHRTGHVAYMDRALERLGKALRKLVKEIEQWTSRG